MMLQISLKKENDKRARYDVTNLENGNNRHGYIGRISALLDAILEVSNRSEVDIKYYDDDVYISYKGYEQLLISKEHNNIDKLTVMEIRDRIYKLIDEIKDFVSLVNEKFGSEISFMADI